MPVPSAATSQIRFTAEDTGPASIVEAGVDAFSFVDLQCQPSCVPGDRDVNMDGVVDSNDQDVLISCLVGPTEMVAGSFCPCVDLDFDGDVDVRDFATLQIMIDAAP